MRTAGLAKLTLVIGLVSVLVGCTPLFKSQDVTPPPLKPDAASEANFQPLSAPAASCSSPILEPERSALLQEALADPQLQAVKAQLERRGLSIKADEAQAVQLAGGQQVLIPFGEDAHLVWTKTNGQTAAVGLIRQGNKTLNVSADGQERVVRFLPVQKVEKLLRKLREKPKFQEFEGKLAQKGKRVGKIRALFDETNKIAILGIANEGDEEKIVHQVRIKLKAGKDDEPEDDAEPAIQATACGQANGKVGAVVAVHPNNAQYAADTITKILGETNYCNGKCFAILIEVDSNGRVVSIRGFGISDDEAKRIAERMGFKEGEPAPWAHSTSSSDVINDKKSLIYVTEPKDPKYCQQCH
ncbi:MAG: hypothetical protein QXX19_08725 [Candidatus Caldarchaeum sp.]